MAHKTKALQVMLSDNVHVALAALVQTLVPQLTTRSEGRTSSVFNVRAQGCDDVLKGVADDIEASRAWHELESRLEIWRERIPGDEDRLLAWLIDQPQSTLLELLALCSALTISVVSGREAYGSGDVLAAAVGLDMVDWWTPTSRSYLAQVPNARIVQAVIEAVSAEQGEPLAKLKKARPLLLPRR